MNTLFIVILFITEIVNLFWTIFIAPYKIDASLAQQIGWIILSGILFIMLAGYFIHQEEINGEENNKSKIKKK